MPPGRSGGEGGAWHARTGDSGAPGGPDRFQRLDSVLWLSREMVRLPAHDIQTRPAGSGEAGRTKLGPTLRLIPHSAIRCGRNTIKSTRFGATWTIGTRAPAGKSSTPSSGSIGC